MTFSERLAASGLTTLQNAGPERERTTRATRPRSANACTRPSRYPIRRSSGITESPRFHAADAIDYAQRESQGPRARSRRSGESGGDTSRVVEESSYAA